MSNVFFSCEQVAEMYHVKVSTVWSWIRNKSLPAVRVGSKYLVESDDLLAFTKAHKTV